MHDLYAELGNHYFEMIKLERRGEMWLAQFAIDGVKYPAFYEPHINVVEMDEDTFLKHMKSQSLGMKEYTQQMEAA